MTLRNKDVNIREPDVNEQLHNRTGKTHPIQTITSNFMKSIGKSLQQVIISHNNSKSLLLPKKTCGNAFFLTKYSIKHLEKKLGVV